MLSSELSLQPNQNIGSIDLYSQGINWDNRWRRRHRASLQIEPGAMAGTHNIAASDTSGADRRAVVRTLVDNGMESFVGVRHDKAVAADLESLQFADRYLVSGRYSNKAGHLFHRLQTGIDQAGDPLTQFVGH